MPRIVRASSETEVINKLLDKHVPQGTHKTTGGVLAFPWEVREDGTNNHVISVSEDLLTIEVYGGVKNVPNWVWEVANGIEYFFLHQAAVTIRIM